jgi:fructosamine-3-kinase
VNQLDERTLKAIAATLREITGTPFTPRHVHTVGGGCINSAYRLEDAGRDYFVKLNRRESLPMFEAEAEGLRAIAATATVRVPRPVGTGLAGSLAYLILEYLPLRPGHGASDRLLGWQLAGLHRIEQSCFGWTRDNTLGSTPQPNPLSADWVDFWAQHRLGFQLRLAAERGYGGRLQRRGEELLARLGELLAGHAPKPSLLHGDLWGGNAASDDRGRPVIFDPACYHGDRETDLAMTELFGGFGPDFYAAYRDAYPLDAGYATRKILYNLYHVLNHLNLFGGGYLGQAEAMAERLLAELK